jgi:hypothetical protein
MAAVTRWVKYDIDAVGSATVGSTGGIGTRGHAFGKGTIASGVNIGPTTCRLYLTLDGANQPTDPVTLGAGYITLYSGSNLDPRFVARDITEKLHAAGSNERFTNATCLWEDCYVDDGGEWQAYTAFKIYSGTRGASSAVSVAASGTNSAHAQLGFTSGNIVTQGGGANNLRGGANGFNGTISVSGTYYGMFDEEYMVVITNDDHSGGDPSTIRGVDTGNIVKNITYDGTMTIGGIYNGSGDRTYKLTIDVTNGTTMGAGRGNVPRMKWETTAGGADTMKAGYYVELLYPNYWYSLGTKGLQVKFTDAVFGAGHWSIPVYQADYSDGTNVSGALGTARMLVTSKRGDYIDADVVTPTAGNWAALGSKGLYVSFSGSNNLNAGDEFRVNCAGPHPGSQSNYNISSLNFGNVTVSTDSDVKCVLFEIEAGAEEMSTVKFGLQNHGSFNHHNENNSDTKFRFGTVGPDNIKNGYEWYPNVLYTDIDSDVPPAYLYATEDNLSVVSTADLSESVGNYELVGLTSDPVWLSIHLGASETGANSTINYRLYFDYS